MASKEIQKNIVSELAIQFKKSRNTIRAVIRGDRKNDEILQAYNRWKYLEDKSIATLRKSISKTK